MSPLLLSLACAPSAPPRPDVLLVTLDTVRADRIGAYGDPSAHTPALDGLASRGTRFAHAWSPAPLTVPAHAGLMTGRYPARFGVRGNGDGVLPPGVVTLAERLRDHGWRTAASVGAVVTSRAFGFDQGFERFFDRLAPTGGLDAERPGREVVDDLLAWESRTRDDPAPRFAWAHLYDAHLPYRAPESWRAVVGDRPYEAEIAEVDAQVGRLLDAFGHRPTLVVVVADHGESLGEHGEDAHGMYVYGATQHVPLLVAGPGVPVGVDRTWVSLVDVAPMVLERLGLPPLPAADGAWPAADGRPIAAESWQLAERFATAPHRSVVVDGIELVAVPRPELYDLRADPAEVRDLGADRAADVARLAAALDALALPPPSPRDRTSDPVVTAQLEALGYLTAAASVAGVPTVDPKDRAELIAGSQAADRLALAGRPEEAASLLASLALRYPDVVDLEVRRAWLLVRAGRGEEAAAVVRDALGRHPEDPTLRLALAARLAAEGRFVEAAVLYREAAEAQPWSSRARTLTLMAMLDAGRPDDAAAQGASWVEQYPDDLGVAAWTGTALLRLRRPAEAMPLLERAATADHPERGVLYQLSAAAAGRGDPTEAVALLDRELVLYPDDAEALAARCAWHAKAGETDRQRDLAARMLARHPDDPVAWHCEAAALLALGRPAEARAAVDRGLAIAPTLPLLRALDAELRRREGRPDP